MIQKKYLLIIFLIITSVSFAGSQPTTPRSIEGFVFLNNGTGVDNGFPVIINNTNTNQIFETEVYAPPFPAYKGYYSVTIQGNLNDLLIVRAYNDTHYGETSKAITGTNTEINVTLNTSRLAELNVSIIFPENDSVLDINSYYNVSVNITSRINTANQCVAVLSVTNTNAVTIFDNINIISQILKDETITTDFEIFTDNPGVTNISVEVTCDDDTIMFGGKRNDAVHNVSVKDELEPVITIINPANNTEEKTNNEVLFIYEVNDDSSISECSLIINSSVNSTSYAVPRGVQQNFSANLDNNYYEWEITCEDAYNNIENSGIYNLQVSVFTPIIEQISIANIINLNPGTEKNVECNITVSDGNGVDDIDELNVLLHLENVVDFTPNNNFVYYNNSCFNYDVIGNTAYYSCSFDVQYYANNGTWLCNATVIDNQALFSNNFTETLIDTLFAINLSALQIDYGEIEAGSVSNEENLIVYNIGNQPLDIHVRAYGGDNPVTGENFAMICDNSETIPVSNQRFSNITTLFNNKQSLSSSFQTITSMEKQTTTPISRNTYWQLRVPGTTITNCEGTIVFSVTG